MNPETSRGSFDTPAGTLIKDRYEVREKIGEGGFAETFLALDHSTGRECVLKQLSWKDIPDWKVIELFEREARVLSQIDHPQIPRFVEFFTVEVEGETRITLVQEYIEGKNLAGLIREGKHFTEQEVIEIALQATNILEYLQGFSPAIIHRDIKPSNLLLSEDGHLHLIDFGAVRDKVLHYQKTESAGFTVVGTYGYMPFEQFQGQAMPQSDIYSLGVSLISLLSHREPHEMELVGTSLNFEPYVNVSDNMKLVLRKMVEHNWQDRYETAGALRADLMALQSGNSPEVIKKKVKPDLVRFVLSGTAVLPALLLGVFLVARSTPPIAPSQSRQPPLPAKQVTQPVEQDQLKPAIVGKISARGKIFFDGKPVTEITKLRPQFWFRNETTGKVATAEARYADGEFEIYGLEPGEYGMSAQFDTNASNPINYPGDLRVWQQFTVSGGSPVTQEVNMLKIIHLKTPEDNGAPLRDWSDQCETGRPAHSRNLKLQWESLGNDVQYDYTISRYACPYKALGSVASGSTAKNTVSVNLPAGKKDEYYMLQLSARKEGRSVGMFIVHGANGYGWDYRFKVE